MREFYFMRGHFTINAPNLANIAYICKKSKQIELQMTATNTPQERAGGNERFNGTGCGVPPFPPGMDCRAGEARRTRPHYGGNFGAPRYAPGYRAPMQQTGPYGNHSSGMRPVTNANNGIGTAGFVVSLLACFSGMFMVPAVLLWLVGLILSAIGMNRTPRGLAIAGFVISLVPLLLIVLLVFLFGIAAVFS